jgi:hypothetical protein
MDPAEAEGTIGCDAQSQTRDNEVDCDTKHPERNGKIRNRTQGKMEIPSSILGADDAACGAH